MEAHAATPRTLSRPVVVVAGTALLALVVVAVFASGGDTTTAPAASTSMYSWNPLTYSLTTGVGSPEPGIGDINSQYWESFEYAPWGLSLSGNGMLAEAAGAGTLRALNDVGLLKELATISSVSGGSWFNTQFAYVKDYFESVTGSEDLATWYTSYQQTTGAAQGAYMMSGATSFTWEGLIAPMYSQNAASAAVQSNRAGNTNADLLICTTLAAETSLMSDGKTVQMSKDGTVFPFSTPAFWSVPTDTSKTAQWNVPDANPTDPADLSGLEWSVVGDSSIAPHTDVASIFKTPTVSKIGSMSSAANGASANPALKAKFQSGGAGNTWDDLFGAGDGMPVQGSGAGVCLTDADTCSFPGMMTMDGCYSDNLGFALNVGYLQRKFPGKKLRIMAMTSDMCDKTTDPTCLKAVTESSWRSFFADSPYPKVEGWLPAIVPGPDRTIFAESITDTQALGKKTGYGSMTYTTGTFTTVKNDHFGVAAGTSVTLLVINANGPTFLQGQTAAQMAELSAVATDAYSSVTDLLATFKKTGKL